MKVLFKNQQGTIHTLPLLVIIAAIGVISFLLISSSAPLNGLIGKINPKPISKAAVIDPTQGPYEVYATRDGLKPASGATTGSGYYEMKLYCESDVNGHYIGEGNTTASNFTDMRDRSGNPEYPYSAHIHYSSGAGVGGSTIMTNIIRETGKATPHPPATFLTRLTVPDPNSEYQYQGMDRPYLTQYERDTIRAQPPENGSRPGTWVNVHTDSYQDGALQGDMYRISGNCYPNPTPVPTSAPNTVAPTVIPLQSCLNGPVNVSNAVTVSWNTPDIKWVDIAKDPNFTDNYNKSITTGFNSTKAPMGFNNGYQYIGNPLTIHPNTPYYVRIINGSTSPTTTFTIPACSPNYTPQPDPTLPPPVIFNAILNGSNEVPSTSSNGTGTARIEVINNGTQAKVTLNFSGLSSTETGAHFHLGGSGNTGPIEVTLPLGQLSSTLVDLPQYTYGNMLTGYEYINVHSQNNPGGEIRDQILIGDLPNQVGPIATSTPVPTSTPIPTKSPSPSPTPTKTPIPTMTPTPGPIVGGSFVTGVTVGGEVRNDYDGFLGMQITTGGSSVTVTALGRYFIAGNSGTHLLKVVRVSDGVDLATTNITMSAGTADQAGLKYSSLSAPITLAAGTSYYVVSQEISGGDSWYGDGTINQNLPTLTTSNIASVTNGIYYAGGWFGYGGVGNSYGPVSFKYQGSSTPTPTPTSTPTPSPTPNSCPKAPLGDIDCNGKIDIFDYNILVTNFAKTGTGIPGDIDGSGKVDIFDYNILVTNFGK